MSFLSKWIFAFFLGLVTVFTLSCGGEVDGKIETGTDFSLSVGSTQFNLPPGSTAATPVQVTWVGCPPRDVTFEVQGIPPGITALFTVNPSPYATQVQLRVDSSVKGGTYDLLLRANSQTLVHTKTLKLIVDSSAPSFTAAISPDSLNMDSGHPGNVSIQITRTGGFSAPMSVEALVPPGFSASLPALAQPGLAAADETKVLTISCGSAAPGSYTVKVVVSAGGQLFQKELGITVFALPSIASFTATPSTIDFGGSSTLLPLFSGGVGTLSPSIGTVASGQTYTVSPLATTAFDLTVTNPVGSTATASAPVTVRPVGVVIIPAAATLSATKSVPLSAIVSGAVNPSLNWSVVEPGGGSVVASGLSATYTAPPTPGTYHVRATSVADPSRFGEFTATVVLAPTASLSAASTTITAGTSTTLTPLFNGGTATLEPALGPLTSGVAISTGPLFTTTTYTLTVMNAAGETATASSTITVSAAPITTITAPNPVTENQAGYTASVPVQPGSSYAWSITNGLITSALTGPSITFTAGLSTTTDLQCTVTNAAGTSGTGTKSLSLVPPPIITTFSVASASPGSPFPLPNPITNLLYGEPLLFGANFTGGTGVIDQGIGAILDGVGLFGASIKAQPSGTTTYTLTVTNPAGTTATAIVTTTVQTITVTIDPAKKPNFFVTTSEYRCMDASVTGAYDSTYTWMVFTPGGGTFAIPQDCTDTYTAPATPGSYLLKALSNADSSVYDSTTADVVAPPTITTFTYPTLNVFTGNYETTPVFTGTATGTASLYDYSDPAAPVLLTSGVTTGVAVSVGPSTTAAYKLEAINAASASAVAYASAITIAATSPTTVKTTGASATTTPSTDLTVTSTNLTDQILWDVNPTNGGSVSGSSPSAGNFTGTYSPSKDPGTYVITARSQSDPSKTASFTVTVFPFFLWPANQTVGLNHQVVLHPSVLGSTANPAITWSMDPSTPAGADYGTVDANGVYTSPAVWPPVGTPPPPPAIPPVVVATLTSDPTVKASISVSVSTAINGGGRIRNGANPPTAVVGLAGFEPRVAHTLTTLANQEILLAGGEHPMLPGTLPTTGYYYRTLDQTFYQTSTGMISGRKWHTATLLPDGSVLLAGGQDGAGNPLDTAERFIPYSSFGGYFQATTGNLAKARANHSATLLSNGKVLLVGGQTTASPLTFEASAELYDPATDTFTLLGSSLRSPRVYHQAVRLLNGKVLIAGGTSDGSNLPTGITSQVDLFNPADNTFSAATDMAYAVMNSTMDLAPNGNAVLAGGNLANGAPFSEFMVYAEPTNTWTPAVAGPNPYPSLSMTRFLPMGMMLPDTTFLVWGGSGVQGFDCWVPGAGALDFTQSSGALDVPVYQGTHGRLVLMLNGKLLVAGWDGQSASPFRAVTYP